MFHLEYILSFSFSVFYNLVGGLAIMLIDSGSE